MPLGKYQLICFPNIATVICDFQVSAYPKFQVRPQHTCSLLRIGLTAHSNIDGQPAAGSMPKCTKVTGSLGPNAHAWYFGILELRWCERLYNAFESILRPLEWRTKLLCHSASTIWRSVLSDPSPSQSTKQASLTLCTNIYPCILKHSASLVLHLLLQCIVIWCCRCCFCCIHRSKSHTKCSLWLMMCLSTEHKSHPIESHMMLMQLFLSTSLHSLYAKTNHLSADEFCSAPRCCSFFLNTCKIPSSIVLTSAQ